MTRAHYIAAGIVLGLTLLAEFYFWAVFNESTRHAFDAPAMLFVAPGLLLHHFLDLRLPFDGPHHSAVIWLSGLVYAAASVGTVSVIQRVQKSRTHHRAA